MKKEKFYVIWAGGTPGICTSRTDCQLQTKDCEGAKYKPLDTHGEAEKAFVSSPCDYIKHNVSTGSKKSGQSHDTDVPYPTTVPENSLAVGAAYSGNLDTTEYRGAHVANRQQVLHFGPIYDTNNTGEFLAIVRGPALLRQRGLDMSICSDSANAISWVKQKKYRTKLPHDPKTEEFFQPIERAEKWLRENAYSTPILKWETRQWGEIPVGFRRK